MEHSFAWNKESPWKYQQYLLFEISYDQNGDGPIINKNQCLHSSLSVATLSRRSNVVAGERQVLNKLQSDEVAERRNASEERRVLWFRCQTNTPNADFQQNSQNRVVVNTLIDIKESGWWSVLMSDIGLVVDSWFQHFLKSIMIAHLIRDS